MEDFVQLLAIVIILGASAVSSLFKNRNQGSDDEVDEIDENETMDQPEPQRRQRPSAPMRPMMADSIGDDDDSRASTYETAPQRKRKPIQRRRRPADESARNYGDSEGPVIRREPIETPPEQKDTITEIFKTLFEAEDPEIVVEEERPKPKPRPKPAPISAPEPPKSQRKPAPMVVEIPEPSQHPFFVRMTEQAAADPLKVAVILSEVMKRPRRAMPTGRFLDRR